MSEALGRQLAQFQDALVQEWHEQGPLTVKQHLEQLSHTELVTLLMLNIGAQAGTL